MVPAPVVLLVALLPLLRQSLDGVPPVNGSLDGHSSGLTNLTGSLLGTFVMVTFPVSVAGFA